MSDGLVLLALVLAAYRIWRLVAVDEVFDSVRGRVIGEGFLHTLLSCAWCAGSWVAFAAVGGLWAVRPLPLPALWFGAVAAGVGLVHTVAERLEPGDW